MTQLSYNDAVDAIVAEFARVAKATHTIPCICILLPAEGNPDPMPGIAVPCDVPRYAISETLTTVSRLHRAGKIDVRAT